MQIALLFSGVAGTVAWSSLRGDIAHAVLSSEDLLDVNVFANGMPTALRCIINITALCLIVYTSLALVRTYHDCTATARSRMESGLTAAAKSASCGPMMCALFVACCMHVRFLSHGKGGPQFWVEACMFGSSCALLALVVATFATAMLQPRVRELQKDIRSVERSRFIARTLAWVEHSARCTMCVGVGLVIKGIYHYQPPAGTWEGPVPAPAPAVACTTYLAVAFFATHCVTAFPQTYGIFLCARAKNPKNVEMILTNAANVVAIAPMLSILFMAARMRALQTYGIHGAPQRWAQICFFNSTFAVAAQAVLAIAGPLQNGGLPPKQKEVTMVGMVLTVFRWVTTLCIYGGPLAVLWSMFVLDLPKAPGSHVPISPSVQCVMNLMVQLLLAYMLVRSIAVVGATVESAHTIVHFAPMLSILIVAARLHALQLTDDAGSPQLWAQDSMFIATWAVLIQFALSLGAATITAVKTDKNGDKVRTFSNKAVAGCLVTLRYLSALFLLCGVGLIVTSIVQITPNIATGQSASLLAIVSRAH